MECLSIIHLNLPSKKLVYDSSVNLPFGKQCLHNKSKVVSEIRSFAYKRLTEELDLSKESLEHRLSVLLRNRVIWNIIFFYCLSPIIRALYITAHTVYHEFLFKPQMANGNHRGSHRCTRFFSVRQNMQITYPVNIYWKDHENSGTPSFVEILVILFEKWYFIAE